MAFRTDLAREALSHSKNLRNAAGIRQTQRTIDGFTVDCVEVLSREAAEELGKPCGAYCTMTLAPLTRRESEAFPHAVEVLSGLLTELLPNMDDDASVLVIGLGNRAITPDAVGPLCIEHILATRHLRSALPEQFGSWRAVSAAAVGVLGQTGVEAAEFTRGLCDTVKPSAVIVVDALAAGSLPHLARTIQVTDAGIVPGSGVENARQAFNREAFGVPVIAVGLPTVVDGASLLWHAKQQGAVCPELEELSGPVFVTPREIDQQVHDEAKVIGYAINRALQPHLSIGDLDLLLS